MEVSKSRGKVLVPLSSIVKATIASSALVSVLLVLPPQAVSMRAMHSRRGLIKEDFMNWFSRLND